MRRAALLLAAALLATGLAAAGCARKGDPLPPPGSEPLRPAPTVSAPSEVGDPITDRED